MKAIDFFIVLLVRQKGLEPPTYWFVASYSIQLSYCRMSAEFPLGDFYSLS